MMKFPTNVSSSPVILAIVFCAIFACLTSFHRLNTGSYMSTPSCAPCTNFDTDPNPLSLSMPDRNCTCRLSYSKPRDAPQLLSSRALSALLCDCHKSPPVDLPLHASDAGRVNRSTSVELGSCPVCPPQEMKIVEKEVVKGAVCPPPEVQILEKNVVKEVAKACPGAPWYAEGKEWHYPAKFPLCSMDACFNYSKCENMEEPLVYTYSGFPTPPARYFSRINESKYWTNDPAKACLFFVFLDAPKPWAPRLNDLPHWNGGRNHVLITFADNWDRSCPCPSRDSIGMASIMGSIVHQTTNRAGFDIGIPLPGKNHLTKIQSVKALERKYFATFQGTRYLGARGDGVFRSFDSFRGMHNGEDMIVVTTCRNRINDLIREEHPHMGVNCDEDAKTYASYNFYDLMNSTFGIVPAGRQPSSYRFIEVLSAGAIPVLISDNYVKPFDTLIHWHKCLLHFPTSEMHRIVSTLRALRKKDIVKRQENCLAIYNEFLKDDDSLQEAAFRALKDRFTGVFPNFAQV